MSELKQTTRDAYLLASAVLEISLKRTIIDDMLTSEAMSSKTDEEKQEIKKAIRRLAENLAKRVR